MSWVVGVPAGVLTGEQVARLAGRVHRRAAGGTVVGWEVRFRLDARPRCLAVEQGGRVWVLPWADPHPLLAAPGPGAPWPEGLAGEVCPVPCDRVEVHGVWVAVPGGAALVTGAGDGRRARLLVRPAGVVGRVGTRCAWEPAPFSALREVTTDE